MERGTAYSTFHYNPNRARIVQTASRSTTIYLDPAGDGGKLFEIDYANNIATFKHYVGGLLAVAEIRLNQTTNVVTTGTKYFHKDHLGSIDVVTDQNGAEVERLSFDAFGARRVAGTWSDPTGFLLATATHHGYTGHEHLDDVGLIHMNGRLYDPLLGRFLSADPNIQAPRNTQSLNRYSYVLNNPLSYTDPSGFFFKKLKSFFKKYWRTIASIAVAAVVMSIPGMAPVAGQMLAGFLSGLVGSGGDLRAGIIGALSGALFAGVGEMGLGSKLGQMFAHGMAGGISSVMNGQKFGEGFISAMATKGFAIAQGYAAFGIEGPVGAVDYLKNAAVAAVVGGTAAVLGGGKFANGAVTGAFSRLFNDLGQNHGRWIKEPDVEKTSLRASLVGTEVVDEYGTTVIDYRVTGDLTFEAVGDDGSRYQGSISIDKILSEQVGAGRYPDGQAYVDSLTADDLRNTLLNQPDVRATRETLRSKTYGPGYVARRGWVNKLDVVRHPAEE